MPDQLPPNKNTGVLKPYVATTDFQVGGETGVVYEARVPTGDWSPYLPTDERQFGKYFDTSGCVTFSALNMVEAQVNYMVANNLIPADKLQWLITNGYFDENGKFNCSDRFTAKMSGTTSAGNYPQRVWDSIRNDGILPEKDWPFPRDQVTPVFDWNAYYAEIPQELKDKAKLILSIFDFQYEWVIMGWTDPWTPAHFSLVEKHLKHSPIQVAAPVSPGWSTDPIVQRGDLIQPQHGTIIYTIEQMRAWVGDYDHYNPFRKKLAPNYCLPWLMKGIVTVKAAPVPPPVVDKKFYADMLFGQKSATIVRLQDLLKQLGYFKLSVQSTGYYGEYTRDAVFRFQVAEKVAPMEELIEVNGKAVRAKTRAALNKYV